MYTYLHVYVLFVHLNTMRHTSHKHTHTKYKIKIFNFECKIFIDKQDLVVLFF